MKVGLILNTAWFGMPDDRLELRLAAMRAACADAFSRSRASRQGADDPPRSAQRAAADPGWSLRE